MSAIMGCHVGAVHTGLVHEDKMPWAYKACTDIMQRIIGEAVDLDMDDVKQAVMTLTV